MQFICLDCKSKYDEDNDKCPFCASLNKEIIVTDTARGDDSTWEMCSKVRHHGKPDRQYFSRYDVCNKTGEIVKKERHIDRIDDKYYEDVVTLDGRSIHHCEEKLTEHINHGSAKRQQ